MISSARYTAGIPYCMNARTTVARGSRYECQFPSPNAFVAEQDSHYSCAEVLVPCPPAQPCKHKHSRDHDRMTWNPPPPPNSRLSFPEVRSSTEELFMVAP